MTEQERQLYLKAIKDFTAEKLAEGPEACRRYLIELGVYDEDGNITRQYGGN